jgi:hypothetical protein
MQVFTADWVQDGELGFAFVVVILCSTLIFYVVRSSERREEKLLEALMQSNMQLSKITQVIQQMKDEICERLNDVENKLNIRKASR